MSDTPTQIMSECFDKLKQIALKLERENAALQAELLAIKQAETRAWWIVCDGIGRVIAHNAIADYRAFDRNATVVELIERPTK